MRRRLLALGLTVGGACWLWFCRRDPVVDTAVPAEVPEVSSRDISRETPPEPRLAGWASISGVVRDEHGRPISGATVCAAGRSRLLDRRDSEARSCGASEDDGRYRIAGLWPVPHSVHASAPHFVPAAHRPRRGELVTLRAGHETTDVDISLRGGGVELRGVVYDLSGGVLEGALVSAGGAHGGSDAEGQFSLWVAPGQVYVTARAEGYAQGSQPGIAPGQWFELRLTPESVLVGRVVRAGDHAPLADASVFVHESSAWHEVGPAISDADGNFRVEGLMPGTYRLEVRHDEAYGTASESAVLGLGETSAPIVIAAHPAFLVAGTVEFADGEPCPGGRVQLAQRTGTTRVANIEPDGRVHVQGVLPGSHDVTIECHGAAPLPEYPAVVIVDAPLPGQRWQVQRGQAIRGEVVLATGEGVPDLWIRAETQPDPAAPRAHTSGNIVNGQSEADGTFTLAGLLPGRYTLRVGSHEYPEAEQPVQLELRAGHDLEGVRITLPATGELRGTVKDSDGAPVKAVEVQLLGGRGQATTRTADDGSFHLAHVAAGEYRAIARADGHPLRSPGSAGEGVPVQVRVGEVEDVELVVVVQRGEIRGRVLGGDSGPVVDAFVEPVLEQGGPGAAR
jgi:protocatechuate 3,4-dioxygenase beta subunit